MTSGHALFLIQIMYKITQLKYMQWPELKYVEPLWGLHSNFLLLIF